MASTLVAPETEANWAGTLKTLRAQRGWTIRQLADRAGVGRTTISRWERGLCRPSPPELDRVLERLGSDEPHRRRILDLSQPADLDHLPPVREFRQGLLRALRRRTRLSLAEAAQRTGVAKATFSRWESGDRTPDGETLARAASRLGASAEEVRAFVADPRALGAAPGSPEACAARLRSLRAEIPAGRRRTLDLEFLAMDAYLAAEGQTALRLEARATYVEWLGWWYRDREASELAARVLPLLPRFPEIPAWGRLVRARGNYLYETEGEVEGTIRLFRQSAEILRGRPSEGYVLRELAAKLSDVGKTETSRALLGRAREAGGGEENAEVHRYCCAMVESWSWFRDNDVDRAVDALPASEAADPYLRFSSVVGRAQTLDRAGESRLARSELERAYAEACARSLDHFAQALRRRIRSYGA